MSDSFGFWTIEPEGTSKSVASPLFGFGVTMRWPSELIQWACGWAMGSPSRCASRVRSIFVAYGLSSITALPPLRATCSWSVSVLRHHVRWALARP